MMVTFVSQCEKKALNRTRRVLDAFADRIGDNTWQTVITQEGLLAVKKLLRKTASKNTAVSCHWIRGRSRTELVWVVGNKRKFNEQGVVPVNFTENAIEQYMDSGQWQTLEVIKYAAAIAGLFHDFGKANILFQQKLDPKKKKNKKKDDQAKTYEPYRHEWVSLRLFQAFVGSKSDEEWLEALSQVEKDQSTACFRDGIDTQYKSDFDKYPLQNLPHFAQLVAWLILTHHKLPLTPSWKDDINNAPLKDIEHWFTNGFDAIWNSYNCKDVDIKSLIGDNWKFTDFGLPYQSMKWRSHACVIASEAKTVLKHLNGSRFLCDNIFTSHLARLSLMLADHYYSVQDKTEEWQNPNYKVYANTDKNKALKQQLDEHLIGVAYHAKAIVKALPKLNGSSKRLRSLPENAFLEGDTLNAFKEQFGWQDDAKRLALKLSESCTQQGFFGINMASTGKGKTLANAKIMYALGEKTGRQRFSVALGLRTLTLQTGREYRTELELSDEQLAIAVGGSAVKQLFENAEQNKNKNDQEIDTGSESQNDYLDPDLYVDYEGSFQEHSLSKWTKDNPRIEKLIQTPVLVCTIDHLVPATEGTRGGKQIAPMLRLLTSDLVIDEPDDFGLDDLPALCRLVHWAGMLGSRVLLSTATMPPALAYAAFEAYQAGWSQYAKANLANWNGAITCAWFDEKNNKDCNTSDFGSFKKAHKIFVDARKTYLQKNEKVKHKVEILAIEKVDQETVYQTVARVIQQGALQLHQRHGQEIEQKHVSIGLVRMANINPLVAVAKEMLKLKVSQQDTRIHLCVYHSRFPLAIRSYLENKLDLMLKRNSKQNDWPPQELKAKVAAFPEKHQIFIVLASPVAEVGRDHDYDWAIIEPSSMRSIIQIAGRVLRHRDKEPEHANILLLDKNIKCLKGVKPCFERPGFELAKLKLAMVQHDLTHVLYRDQYQTINSIQRITAPDKYDETASQNLVSLEHKALRETLLTSPKAARLWWDKRPFWCGEVQKQQRFRDSKKDEALYLTLDNDETKWQWKNEHVYPARWTDQISGSGFSIRSSENIEIVDSNGFWFELTAHSIYQKLAEDLNIDIETVGKDFGEIRLVSYVNKEIEEYSYDYNLGVYQKSGDQDGSNCIGL